LAPDFARCTVRRLLVRWGLPRMYRNSVLALFLAQDGASRRMSANLDEPKARDARDSENTGKTQENSGKSGLKVVRGRVSEWPKEPVLKTGVAPREEAKNKGDFNDSQNQLGAFLGALAEHLADAPGLSTLLGAWPHLPEPAKAGIVAMVKVAGATAQPDGRLTRTTE